MESPKEPSKKKIKLIASSDTKTDSSINLICQSKKTNNGNSIMFSVGSNMVDLSNLKLAIAFICDVSGSMQQSVSDNGSTVASQTLQPITSGLPPPPMLMPSGNSTATGLNSFPLPPMLSRQVSCAVGPRTSAAPGSNSHVGNDTQSRIGVLIGSMKRIFKLFAKYASRGAEIRVSLAVFSDNYHIYLNNELVKPDFLGKFLPNISHDKWFALRGGTNFKAAIDAKNIFTKKFADESPDCKQLTFLASDGYHLDNGEITRDSLLGTPEFNITLCVGDNVDEELMENLGNQTDFGTDERTLQDCLEGRVFEQSAEVAKNLTFEFKDSERIISPLEFEDDKVQLKVVRPGHIITMFHQSSDEEKDEDIPIKISYDTPSGKTISFEMCLIPDTKSNMKEMEGIVIEIYSKISVRLNTLINNNTIDRDERTEEFRKMHDEITALESSLTDDNCSHNVHELLVSFKQHLDKARECMSNDAQYLELLRQTSVGLSSCSQPLSLMRERSSAVIDDEMSTDSEDDSEKKLCKICFTKESAVNIRPCNHFFGCKNCIATHLQMNNTCPICRGSIHSIREFELISTKCMHPGCSKDVNTVLRDCNHACMCTAHATKLMVTRAGCLHCSLPISRVQPITIS